MRSALLQRRLAALTEAARRAVWHRETLRDRAKAWDSICAALGEAKIDPGRVWALRQVAAAGGELSRLGDTPDLRRADAAFVAQDRQLSARESYAAICARRASRFAGRSPPDPGASLFDWYAWALAIRSERGVESGVAAERDDSRH